MFLAFLRGFFLGRKKFAIDLIRVFVARGEVRVLGEGVRGLFRVASDRVYRIAQIDYCGVDLLKGPHGEPILCEVNSNAFIQGIEKVTGINVAGAYASYIYKEVYK